MSLRHRIVLFFLSLLIVSTIATIGSVLLATNNSVKTQAQSKLVVGKNVFEQLLFERGNQLLNAATVLVADFGFKDAITSNDGATIKSALVNNQERINADLMLLITLEGNIISSDQQSKLDKALLKELLILAQTQNGTSGIVMINEDIYQFVMLPVKAPVTLAWTLIATRIDKDFAQQLKALTNLDVVFKAHDKKYKTVIVSTIESLSTKDNLDNTEARLLDTILNDHNDFLTLPVQLAD